MNNNTGEDSFSMKQKEDGSNTHCCDDLPEIGSHEWRVEKERMREDVEFSLKSRVRSHTNASSDIRFDRRSVNRD